MTTPTDASSGKRVLAPPPPAPCSALTQSFLIAPRPAWTNQARLLILPVLAASEPFVTEWPSEDTARTDLHSPRSTKNLSPVSYIYLCTWYRPPDTDEILPHGLTPTDAPATNTPRKDPVSPPTLRIWTVPHSDPGVSRRHPSPTCSTGRETNVRAENRVFLEQNSGISLRNVDALLCTLCSGPKLCNI